MSNHLIRVLCVYRDSDAAGTRALHADLQACGVAGQLAVNLLRACKKSERAKVYRGYGALSFKRAAYEGKNWALDQIVGLLVAHPALVLSWGWGVDEKQPVHRHVLYLDLPNLGQVSFHSGHRGEGPDYTGEWNRRHRGFSAQHACTYAARVLEGVVL